MPKVIIIGAGLTGLSVAYHLELAGFYDYQLIEKESEIGGLCRSMHIDGYTFDYTGHLLHINDPYFRTFIETKIGLGAFTAIKRSSVIYSQNKITPYPFQINLYGLPPETIIECIIGFIQRRKCNPRTFYQWVLANFGAGLGKYFFFPYQQKIFDYDVRKLTASWTGRFVPKTSLTDILRGSLMSTEEAVGYNAHFLYPRQKGIFYWIEKLASYIKNPIIHNTMIEKVDLKEKIIYTQDSSIEYSVLINTMPLKTFISVLKEKSDTHYYSSYKKLLCNKVINFNLGIKRPTLSQYHWMYFPEKEFPFYRLGFPFLFSDRMTPAQCSSLYGEIAFLNKSSAFMHEQLQKALQKTKDFFQLADNEIDTELIVSIDHAYVIYNAWRDKYVPLLLKALKEENIWSVGRYGGWKYASMQENFLEGKAVAEEILAL